MRADASGLPVSMADAMWNSLWYRIVARMVATAVACELHGGVTVAATEHVAAPELEAGHRQLMS
jgi:hypothetical protein